MTCAEQPTFICFYVDVCKLYAQHSCNIARFLANFDIQSSSGPAASQVLMRLIERLSIAILSVLGAFAQVAFICNLAFSFQRILFVVAASHFVVATILIVILASLEGTSHHISLPHDVIPLNIINTIFPNGTCGIIPKVSQSCPFESSFQCGLLKSCLGDEPGVYVVAYY